jgi:hypothetical protein
MDDITKSIMDNIALSDHISGSVGNYLGDMLVKPEELGGKFFVHIALAYFISTEVFKVKPLNMIPSIRVRQYLTR